MSRNSILTKGAMALIFPGQGSQFVGMGADLIRDFPAAREVFQEVDESLNQNLSALMFAGDMDELTQTQNAQPAIMAVSMAVYRVLKSEVGPSFDDFVVAVAGHSLGEYSALCAAGVLSLADTARLLKARGLAMAKACEKTKGGMVALLGEDLDKAAEIAKQSGVYVANDNAPGQVVLSGTLDNLEQVKILAKQANVRKVVVLPVTGAFHSPLMQNAADEMAPVLAQAKFKMPIYPIYFNVTARDNQNVQEYADFLTRQIVAPVRWRELIQNINASCFVECGPGNVLSGLVRRIRPDVETLSLGTSESIQKLLQKR